MRRFTQNTLRPQKNFFKPSGPKQFIVEEFFEVETSDDKNIDVNINEHFQDFNVKENFR